MFKWLKNLFTYKRNMSLGRATYHIGDVPSEPKIYQKEMTNAEVKDFLDMIHSRKRKKRGDDE